MLPKTKASDDMSSFSGSQRPGISDTAEPHILVAYPSCGTKFAVESSAIASLEVPRFHCSRCDTVFVVEEPREEDPLSTAGSPPPAQNPRWVLTDPVKTLLPDPPQHEAHSSPALKPSDFSIGSASSSSATPAAAAPPPYSPRVMNQDLQRESISMGSGLSLLAQGEANLEAHKPVHPPVGTGSRPAMPQPLSPPPASKARNSRPSIPAFSQQPALSAEEELLFEQEGQAATRGFFGRLAGAVAARTRGLVRMSLPLAVIMGSLLLVSYSARVSPRSTDTLLSLLIPSPLTNSVPRLPPTDLAIRDLSLRFVRTSSRDTVAVVSGRLLNASGKSISDVTLEALGFNERGEVVTKARAPLRSALSSEKVSDLDRETIVKFQHALGARDTSIAASETVPFTVALIDQDSHSGDSPDLSQIKFFSARVFSVR